MKSKIAVILLAVFLCLTTGCNNASHIVETPAPISSSDSNIVPSESETAQAEKKTEVAGLLSLVMCLTALVGIGTTTAYAAGERAEVYLVSFPRSGDANIDYSGTWGHPNLRYMNGWHSGESKYDLFCDYYDSIEASVQRHSAMR